MTFPAIFGLSGPALSPDERAFFRTANPAGFILFGRNCESPAQLHALTDALRDAAGGDDLLICIDQEGGRVARLRGPAWPDFPAAGVLAALYEKAPMTAIEAARANAAAMGAVLREAGVTADLAPVLDLVHDGAHGVISDRAFGACPMQVAALGRAVLEGLASAGVLGCIKHMPGHGRAPADSHHELPVVDASKEELAQDFAPFRRLASAPIGMVAHVLYMALDPDRPATLSPGIIEETIRRDIGFTGLLLSDDIAMGALTGTAPERAVAVVAAGCDLALHCSGELAEMEAVAEALAEMSAEASGRLQAIRFPDSPPIDYQTAADRRDALLG